MTPDELRKTLRRATDGPGGVTAWAKKHGIPRQIVSAAMNSDRPIPKSVVAALGLTPVIDYAPINPKFESALMSLRDCSNPDVRKDAEHDLARMAPSEWVTRWAVPLLRGYEGADNSDELAALEIEANELEAEKYRAVSRMDDAATQLERLANREETPDEIADKLTAIIELLDTNAI